MGVFIFWVLCGIAAAMVASSKGRSVGGWFFLGLILGPFGLLFALLAGKEGPAEGERKCPFCAEFIKKEAVVCKHCGRDLPENPIAETATHTDWMVEQVSMAPWRNLTICPICGAKHEGDPTECRACEWKPKR